MYFLCPCSFDFVGQTLTVCRSLRLSMSFNSQVSSSVVITLPSEHPETSLCYLSPVITSSRHRQTRWKLPWAASAGTFGQRTSVADAYLMPARTGESPEAPHLPTGLWALSSSRFPRNSVQASSVKPASLVAIRAASHGGWWFVLTLCSAHSTCCSRHISAAPSRSQTSQILGRIGQASGLSAGFQRRAAHPECPADICRRQSWAAVGAGAGGPGGRLSCWLGRAMQGSPEGRRPLSGLPRPAGFPRAPPGRLLARAPSSHCPPTCLRR